MTPEEAMKLIDIDGSIKHLEECERFAVFAKKENDIKMLKEAIEAFTITSKALKKQIPKKPYLKDLFELGTMQGVACPVCDTTFLTTGEKYCKHCGQALDWGGEE
jgi:hypothetical protein